MLGVIVAGWKEEDLGFWDSCTDLERLEDEVVFEDDDRVFVFLCSIRSCCRFPQRKSPINGGAREQKFSFVIWHNCWPLSWKESSLLRPRFKFTHFKVLRKLVYSFGVQLEFSWCPLDPYCSINFGPKIGITRDPKLGTTLRPRWIHIAMTKRWSWKWCLKS